MPNPTAAMITIGDEILSGRTRDANMPHLAEKLTEKGISLMEARVVPDVPEAIIGAVNTLRTEYTHVFTSGGIGPTHDDITADCVAAAFGATIDVRADAKAILEAHYAKTGTELNEARLRMARIPDGAVLIENPVSKAPGFSLGNTHVMAGIPRIFAAMLEGLLPTLTGGLPLLSQSLRVVMPEGKLAGPLGELDKAYSNVSFGSYPFHINGQHGSNVVIRSTDAELLTAAMQDLRDRVGSAADGG